MIWCCCSIKSTVIDTKAESAVLLADQQNGGGEWARVLLNYTLGEHLSNLLFDFCLLKVWVAIWSDIDRLN